MGTRINVLLEHDLADVSPERAVLSRLEPALPATLAVDDYWRAADSHYTSNNLMAWRAEPVSRDVSLRRYTAPGSLFLTLSPQAAHLRTGARWRGFLTIEPLRRVHMAAFRRVAIALGSRRIAIYADDGPLDDLFWKGASLAQCIEQMNQSWGPPQASVDTIDPRVVAAAEHTVPLVWFLE